MTKVIVEFFTPLRELTGERQTEVKGDNLAKIIDKLVEKYGYKFREEFLDKINGKIKPTYSIHVNGIQISLREINDTKVRDGDIIFIFPVIGGGSYSTRARANVT